MTLSTFLEKALTATIAFALIGVFQGFGMAVIGLWVLVVAVMWFSYLVQREPQAASQPFAQTAQSTPNVIACLCPQCGQQFGAYPNQMGTFQACPLCNSMVKVQRIQAHGQEAPPRHANKRSPLNLPSSIPREQYSAATVAQAQPTEELFQTACRHCNGPIEFSSYLLGTSAACPHCQKQTIL